MIKQRNKNLAMRGNMARRTRFEDDKETEFISNQLKGFNILKYVNGRKNEETAIDVRGQPVMVHR